MYVLYTASRKDIMFLCSIKTKELLGNPSPMPKRFPETFRVSMEISWAEEGFPSGDGFPNTSLLSAVWQARNYFVVFQCFPVFDTYFVCVARVTSWTKHNWRLYHQEDPTQHLVWIYKKLDNEKEKVTRCWQQNIQIWHECWLRWRCWGSQRPHRVPSGKCKRRGWQWSPGNKIVIM